jgi:hypothetical protein
MYASVGNTVPILRDKIRVHIQWNHDLVHKSGEGYFYLCFINEAPCQEDLYAIAAIAPPFLTSVLDGGEWSASRPGRCTTLLIVLVFRGARLDAVERENSLGPAGKLILAVRHVACRYTD